MSNTFKQIVQNTSKICSAISLMVLSAGVVVSNPMSVGAVWNASANRYDDSLTKPWQEATYIYNYENTSPDAAPGYFEIPLETTVGGSLDSLLTITSITDTFPVNPTTFVPTATAQTISTPPASAKYTSSGITYIRVSPQNTCTPSATGCTMKNIPAAVPGKLTIKMAIKTDAPTTASILDGQGKIFFPNGYDINAIGWRINVNYAKTNDVLDPSVMPTAQIMGQGGSGNPVAGQPYTVVTSGIKAVDGNNMNNPSATCKSVIGGTTYTGTGVTNGTCVINVTTNSGSTIPAGTVDLSDGGTPRAITLNGIPYQSVTPGAPTTPLVTADIPSLTVNCTSATVNSTTTCNFTLPANKTLPASFKLGIGDATPAGTCTANGSTVNCTGVPTGSQSGSQPIYGQIGSEAKTATGENVQINPATPTPPPTPLITPITNSDLSSLSFTCGTNNSVSVNSTITCTGTLPANKTLDSNNPLKLAIGSASSLSDTCTANGQTVTCANVPTGSYTGSQPLKAQLGSGGLTNTSTVVNVVDNTPQPTQNQKIISDSDLASIGTGNANDPFTNLVCGAQDVVVVGRTTTCYGTLKDGWFIPSDFKLGVGANPGGTCTQSGQNIVCTNVPVTDTPGNNVIVKAQIGNGSVFDTGKRVSVQSVAPSLARTGGAALIGLGVTMLALMAGFVAYSRYSKITSKTSRLNN